MIYPVYDIELLPCIKSEAQYLQERTRKFLGGETLVGDKYITINITSDELDKVQALYYLWETSCNFGVEPFVITVNLFGEPTNCVVKFVEDLVMNVSDLEYNSTIKLEFIDEIFYLVDDAGAYIVDDSQIYLYTEGV